MEPLYRIEEFTTSGWSLYDQNSDSLTKEDAGTLINQLLAEGYEPSRLRLTRIS